MLSEPLSTSSLADCASAPAALPIFPMDVVIHATDAHSQQLHIEVYIDFYSGALRSKNKL